MGQLEKLWWATHTPDPSLSHRQGPVGWLEHDVGLLVLGGIEKG